ncbi:MAG TPA: hypothetical protein VK527_00410 [Candidatus Limnocylindrales bacterium]|nr:hypothetical protein [Candidatus Limnocylindrales bacterium]
MPSQRLIHSFDRPSVAGLLAVLAVAASLAVAVPARAEDPDWPRQFDSSSGSFVIYQPQPEELDGDVLSGRAAFSLRKSGAASPTFGVLWYTEQIAIDRDSSTVTARSFDVTKVRLPGITSDEESRYEGLMESQAAGWDLSGSLEELQAGLAAAEQERSSVAGLDNAPPKILFLDRRAILVVYDGAPILEPIEGSKLQRAVNTPYAVVFDPRSRSYYLNGANLWYRAKDPLGPWSSISSPPGAVRDIVPPDTTSYDQVEGLPPEVLTATEPTELIATDGPPQYAPLVEDELLYLTNTESDVVLEVSTQFLYVLISGRWFRAPSTDGPWTFVRGDELPAGFKRVPLDSPKGNILASVAGTDQAEDAIADAEIPQTSAIQRSDRSFQVTYDGDPEFEPIEGTDLQYAVNTDAEIILADGRYYACDQGVWYISDYPEGPWYVSDTRPLGVEDIPPSCPVYDVRYVYIYDSTPDVVYVGYTPGYLGCYPYYGTVVYGTGYRYGTWRTRDHYYPRRFTWGFHARYNPWLSRWSFGFSYGTGFLRVGTRWRSNPSVATTRARSKWFGPGGYRRPMVAQDMSLLRARRPGRPRPRVSDGLPANVYNRPENVTRVDRSVDRIRVRSIVQPIARPVPAPDDVFAGKDGKVYRRDPKGTWAVRTGTKWKPTKLPTPPPATPPQERGPESHPSTEQSRPDVSRQRGGPAVEHVAPQRNNPRERPTPPSERPTPPSERPAPSRERPTPPREQPTPPREQPTPGDLEREYHARQRSDREDNSEAPPQKERPEQRSRENARPERNR